MEFLTKIEDFINNLIIKLGELLLKLLKKMVPQKVGLFFNKVQTAISYLKANFKSLPATFKVMLMALLGKTKAKLSTYDYKGKAQEISQRAQEQYRTQKTKGANKFKAPFILMADWLHGLSITQSFMLLGFTCASILSGISIVSSGNRVLHSMNEASRNPASVVEEITYDRPLYYKKDTRHVLVSNVRLPVYIGEINELRSVDIDFNATLSNRQSRKFLEKYEFQLRDYLILNIEPIVASFPLEEEGREMLKRKILLEINNFLKERQIEGQVEEVKITYVLAN